MTHRLRPSGTSPHFPTTFSREMGEAGWGSRSGFHCKLNSTDLSSHT